MYYVFMLGSSAEVEVVPMSEYKKTEYMDQAVGTNVNTPSVMEVAVPEGKY